jgi:hypothetical protein
MTEREPPQLLQLQIPDDYAVKTRVRFVCMSDTHNLHDTIPNEHIPEGDVLLHTGDFTDKGEIENILAFNTFLGRMKEEKNFKYTIVVAGNHDYMMDPVFNDKLGEIIDYKHPLLSNCDYYLEDSAIELSFGDGKIKIFGTPWNQLKMAFGCSNHIKRAEKWKMIPDDIDILMTHIPPLNILDLSDLAKPKSGVEKPVKVCKLCNETHQHRSHLGCASLKEEIFTRVKPKVHVFGHVHASFGAKSLKQDDSELETLFVNAACKWYPIRSPPYFDMYV